MRQATFLFLGLALFAVTAKAQTTYYVTKDGDDSNPCTQSLPCSRIKTGVSKLSAGDTLIVKKGKYKESLEDIIPSGTGWDKPVTVMANPGDKVVLVPKAGKNPARVLFFQNPETRYIILNGFILNAANVQAEAVKITGGATNVRIKDCEIMNSPSQGILISGGIPTYCELINLDIHNNGKTDQHHQIYVSLTSNNRIEGCTLHDGPSHGVHIWKDSGSEGCNDNLITDTVAYNLDRGIGIYGGADNRVQNSIVYNNEIGIFVRNDGGDLQGLRVCNNTVVDNGFGILILSDVGPSLLSNNITFGNDDELRDDTGRAVQSSNLVAVDPLFVNRQEKDFHLQQGSPAIDFGETLTDVTVDKDGTSRPQGNGYDAGAYEYSGPQASSFRGGAVRGRGPFEFDYRMAVPVGLIGGFAGFVCYKRMRARHHQLSR